MFFRVIPFQYYNPILKICFNEVSLRSVKKSGESLFWISGWSEDCINLGAGQNYNLILNHEEIE